MSKHELREPADDDLRLAVPVTVVPVTSNCSARWEVCTDGVAQLVINYGGAELVLEAVTPAHGERLAFELARVALAVASYCRSMMDGRHD